MRLRAIPAVTASGPAIAALLTVMVVAVGTRELSAQEHELLKVCRILADPVAKPDEKSAAIDRYVASRKAAGRLDETMLWCATPNIAAAAHGSYRVWLAALAWAANERKAAAEYRESLRSRAQGDLRAAEELYWMERTDAALGLLIRKAAGTKDPLSWPKETITHYFDPDAVTQILALLDRAATADDRHMRYQAALRALGNPNGVPVVDCDAAADVVERQLKDLQRWWKDARPTHERRFRAERDESTRYYLAIKGLSAHERFEEPEKLPARVFRTLKDGLASRPTRAGSYAKLRAIVPDASALPPFDAAADGPTRSNQVRAIQDWIERSQTLLQQHWTKKRQEFHELRETLRRMEKSE